MEAIWPGSGSAVSESTPFGLYDNDSTFQSDAPKFASWCAKRLGYPITSVELQDSQFYACFEESVTEYSSQVNLYFFSLQSDTNSYISSILCLLCSGIS